MATGNTSWSTLVASTLQNNSSDILDSVSTNNAVLWMLRKAGNIKVSSGGRTFTHPLIYKKNASFQMYDKYGVISTPLTDPLTRAEYNQKVAAGALTISEIDLAQNAGDRNKLLDLAEVIKKEAEISMSELLGDQMFADGTGTNDFGGIPFLINEDPGTQTNVGGIDPSATGNSYWQNYSYGTTVSAFNTSNAGTIAWRDVILNTTFGTQGPNAIVTTKAIYALYELGLTANIRYSNTEMADAGFKNLLFETLPVLFDDNCGTGNTYFIDTDALWLQVLAQANMAVTKFTVRQDQLASSAIMYLVGNLTCGSRRTQGCVDNTTG